MYEWKFTVDDRAKNRIKTKAQKKFNTFFPNRLNEPKKTIVHRCSIKNCSENLYRVRTKTAAMDSF